jgi:hypothetical protein
LGHPGGVNLVVDLDEQVARLDALEIVDRDLAHIAVDLSAERGDVAPDIGIVSGLSRKVADPAVPLRGEQHCQTAGGDDYDKPKQSSAQLMCGRRWRRRRGRGYRRRGLRQSGLGLRRSVRHGESAAPCLMRSVTLKE